MTHRNLESHKWSMGKLLYYKRSLRFMKELKTGFLFKQLAFQYV